MFTRRLEECEMCTTASAGNASDEWKECRATIDRCDKLLVDLRKTGFGFVTAIVGAATFLFAKEDPGGGGVAATAILNAKAAIFCMLALLIVVLYWIDLSHQTLLGVAVERAQWLEDNVLAFKLTGDISRGFVAAQAVGLGFFIYLMLLFAAAAIFWFSVSDKANLQRTVFEIAFVLGLATMTAGLLTWKRQWPLLVALAVISVFVASTLWQSAHP
jgi:hypothetical protein